jgi:hypothetical protein
VDASKAELSEVNARLERIEAALARLSRQTRRGAE